MALFCGTDEDGGDMLATWSAACRAAGWPVRAARFPGGHHFPPDWDAPGGDSVSRRASVAAFLLGG